jgi:hypothetical protein
MTTPGSQPGPQAPPPPDCYHCGRPFAEHYQHPASGALACPAPPTKTARHVAGWWLVSGVLAVCAAIAWAGHVYDATVHRHPVLVRGGELAVRANDQLPLACNSASQAKALAVAGVPDLKGAPRKSVGWP